MVREFRKIDYILVHGRSPTAFRIIQVIQNIYSDDKIIQFTIETRILLKQLKGNNTLLTLVSRKNEIRKYFEINENLNMPKFVIRHTGITHEEKYATRCINS